MSARTNRTGARHAAFLEPMKALAVARPPSGAWRCEIKYDGFRAIAVLNAGVVELWSRNHKPLDAEFPEVVAALRKLGRATAVLDGEIVAVDAEGRSRFQFLQGRETGERPRIVFYVFDLLRLGDSTLLAEPLERRQQELAVLLRDAPPPLRLSPVFDEPPAELLAAARKQGLEGIVAKRPGSLYEVGRRSGAWLKCKVLGEQEFVIGGFTAPRRSRQYLGALLLGYHDGGALRYAGKVGAGFDTRSLAALHRELARRRRATCPFTGFTEDNLRHRWSRGPLAAITWVKPELVAQIKFAEWTDDGLLRQPVFLGLRDDKAPREVVRETPPA
ncbi:MAG TPA: non-homologous end-joining DNA ligase [Opitutaceae bacterium]|nr:non-homologous end-joining DNA ligase [Opitutaceae bacterium]